MPHKSKLFFLLLSTLILLSVSCAGLKQPIPYENSAEITAELLAIASNQNSYARHFIYHGETVKTMYFLFSVDGEPFYTFKSEYLDEQGREYVYIYNVDGLYEYSYYPEENIAYRTPKLVGWDESNYDTAKAWHFDNTTDTVIGEDDVDGAECWIISFDSDSILCVEKATGMDLYLGALGKKPLEYLYYENFGFDLTLDDFIIPEGVEVIDLE